jgi:hypothetical protein
VSSLKQEQSSHQKTTSEEPWTWSLLVTNEQQQQKDSNPSSLTMAIPQGFLNSGLEFRSTTVGVHPSPPLRFIPPWRASSSPVKLRQFLRAQKIPLEKRDETRILILSSAETNTLVAVQVHGNWIIHADYFYNPSNNTTKPGFVTVVVSPPPPLEETNDDS